MRRFWRWLNTPVWVVSPRTFLMWAIGWSVGDAIGEAIW